MYTERTLLTQADDNDTAIDMAGGKGPYSVSSRLDGV